MDLQFRLRWGPPEPSRSEVIQWSAVIFLTNKVEYKVHFPRAHTYNIKNVKLHKYGSVRIFPVDREHIVIQDLNFPLLANNTKKFNDELMNTLLILPGLKLFRKFFLAFTTTPLLLRKPCKLFASVARVCQRQLGFLVFAFGVWDF